MKKILQHFLKTLLIMVSLLSAFAYGSKGQASISMSTANCTITADEVQMDIFLTNTGTVDLRWNGTVVRFNLPASMIPAGTQTYTWHYLGGSDFPVSFPTPGNNAGGSAYNAATRLLTWANTSNGAYNNLTCTAPLILQGETKKIGRFSFKITSGTFVEGAAADFVWNATASCNLYQTCDAFVTGFNTAGANRTLITPCSLTVPLSCTSPTVNSNPGDQVICTTGTATFTGLFIGGLPAPTLVWQEQIGGVGLFTDLTETTPYSGTTTNTLTITTPNISLSTNRYRLKANNTCGDVFTNSALLTVNPDANAGIVSGTSPLCIGATGTYSSNGDASGTWSSTNTSIATVDAAGLVTALTAGTTDITYTVSTGCNSPVSSFKTLTISPNVSAGSVSGTSPLCIGATTTYSSNGDAGGTWSSTNTSIATVDAAGLVTALTAGTTDITYTVSTGCNSPVSTFKTLTISPNVSAGSVSGTSPLCIGATDTYLSNGDTGGTWSSTNTSIATVDAAGLVTAVSAGTTDITYTINTGCGSPISTFKTLTVNPNVSAGTVSGTSPLCIDATATYSSDGTTGGTWSSTNTGVATVDLNTGLVTAVSQGTSSIVYTVNSGCGSPTSSSQTVTVQALDYANLQFPSTGTICPGGSLTAYGQVYEPGVTEAPGQGSGITVEVGYNTTNTNPSTWTNWQPASFNVQVGNNDEYMATFGSTLSSGIYYYTFRYSLNSCGYQYGGYSASGGHFWDGTNYISGVLNISANANAGTVTGTSPLCIGTTTTYSSNGDIGGTWSSTNPSVATVNSSGVVTAVSAGATDITYTVNTGCNSPATSFKTFNVNGSTALAGVAGGSMICTNATIQSSGTYYSDASCNAIANVVPSGLVPVSGNVNTCVSIEDVVHTYHNIPYVQRHYDIIPATNAANATATITLYFTQSEFDAFNLARGAYPALPGDVNDVIGISNLRVTQFHGTGTYPGNYTGNSELINPADNNIVWNAGMNRWEVSFDINGFSGFYVFTDPVLPLPITLLNFSGRNNGSNNLLEWTTSSEQNSSYFDLLRSTDGINFVKVGTIAAAGNSNTTKNYNYSDNIAAINTNLYYYRLKMVDITGVVKYSSTVKIRLNSKGFNVEASPNPFFDQLKINVETQLQENATISLNDMSGRKMQQKESLLRKGNNAIQLINLDHIPAGVYLLTITTDSQQQTLKVVKQ